MSKFSRGGPLPGGTHQVRFVDYPSPDGMGSPDVVFADECMISPDGICLRRDEWHVATALQTRARWWICPTHD